jgi:hypothetical protein
MHTSAMSVEKRLATLGLGLGFGLVSVEKRLALAFSWSVEKR